MEHWIEVLLTLLALPKYGLGTLFVVAFVSATLLPLGSEPALKTYHLLPSVRGDFLVRLGRTRAASAG